MAHNGHTARCLGQFGNAHGRKFQMRACATLTWVVTSSRKEISTVCCTIPIIPTTGRVLDWTKLDGFVQSTGDITCNFYAVWLLNYKSRVRFPGSTIQLRCVSHRLWVRGITSCGNRRAAGHSVFLACRTPYTGSLRSTFLQWCKKELLYVTLQTTLP